MKTNRISMQGTRGSFHDIVARGIYGEEIVTLDRESFPEVFEDVVAGRCDVGIIAIENSIAGSILENYDSLVSYDVNIIGEYYLRIKHNLLALPGQELADVTKVRSHWMALKQCRKFLAGLDVELVEYADNATSARDIREKNEKGVAAIGAEIMADLYDLVIVAAGIETDKQNYTRFLVISEDEYREKDANKSSIVVELKHEPGSLARFINVFADKGVNLTKIESRPLVGRPWEYLFYIDYEQNAYSPAGQDLLRELERHAEEVKLLGAYLTHE